MVSSWLLSLMNKYSKFTKVVNKEFGMNFTMLSELYQTAVTSSYDFKGPSWVLACQLSELNEKHLCVTPSVIPAIQAKATKSLQGKGNFSCFVDTLPQLFEDFEPQEIFEAKSLTFFFSISDFFVWRLMEEFSLNFAIKQFRKIIEELFLINKKLFKNLKFFL